MQTESPKMVVLASSFYTAALEKPFEQALARRGHAAAVACAPYNQLHTFLLDPGSVIPEDTACKVVLLLRVEDFIRLELAGLGKSATIDEAACLRVFRQREGEFTDVLGRASRLPLTVMICPAGHGAYDLTFLKKAPRISEHKIAAQLRGQQKHLILEWSEFERSGEPGRWFNVAGDRLGHVPFTPEGLDALADFFVSQMERMPTAMLESGSDALDNVDLERFLAALEVGMSVHPLTGEDEQAVVNLIRHTTHFINLPGGKWEPGSLRALAEGMPGGEAWIARVSDRFGEYGTSGAIVFGIDDGVMRIRFVFLTCPVLGKQVEYALFDWMGHIAQRRQAESIQLPFTPGRDNRILSELVKRLGGQEVEADAAGAQTSFVLPVPGLIERISSAAPNPSALASICSKLQAVEVTP